MNTRYVTVSELIYINGTLLDSEALTSGTRQIRDIALLDAAAARPAASAFGADAYPTLPGKAAALLHSVARNHPFADGNKRTATVGALFLLWVNGFCVLWDQPSALVLILRVAEGTCDADELAAWLPLTPFDRVAPGAIADVTTGTTMYPIAPDADADKSIIAAILAAQKWLLDALELR
ncbi:MAG: type II toxin-antitoxin system death-on-curing family toxin [Chloroflexota bacterium]|nr:type II toxin-antitoxin system death-on-curing family toxin [Chloroflexota bacterium]